MAQRRTDQPALGGWNGWLPLSLARLAARWLCAVVACFTLLTAYSDLARGGWHLGRWHDRRRRPGDHGQS